MALTKLLVANRGEIAIRIMRAAADLGISTVAVYPQDDSESLHAYKADETVVLPGHMAQTTIALERETNPFIYQELQMRGEGEGTDSEQTGSEHERPSGLVLPGDPGF